MKSCFGYVRVSTQKQGEGVSLVAQRDAILAFAARNDIIVTQWFEEKETAAKSGRPIFLSMMKLLMKHRAAGVVLHKVDRGARNLADWAKFAELADAGIDVHFATEALDFRSRGGRLTADIQAVIAADYIRNLREECIKGIDGRLKQGLYPFKAPMGYNDNGGGRVKTIDPIKGPLVKKLFELYATGQYSLRSLPAEIARRGLHSPNGRPISKNGLERILRNPFYCGLIKITRGGATYPGIHERLISANLFEVVRSVRTGRISKAVTRHQYLFHGLFTCALCGTAMVAERQKGHVYYRCHTKTCDTKTVREEAIEEAVTSALLRVRLSDDDIVWITCEFEIWARQREIDDGSNTYGMQLTQIEEKLQRLTDALIERLIDKDAYASRKQNLSLEKMRITEAMEKQKMRPDGSKVHKFLELIKSLSTSYGIGTTEEKRQIVRIATSNRTVSLKYVCVEPDNWLLQVDLAIAGLLGGHSRDTSRTDAEMRDRHVRDICHSINLLRSAGDLTAASNGCHISGTGIEPI